MNNQKQYNIMTSNKIQEDELNNQNEIDDDTYNIIYNILNDNQENIVNEYIFKIFNLRILDVVRDNPKVTPFITKIYVDYKKDLKEKGFSKKNIVNATNYFSYLVNADLESAIKLSQIKDLLYMDTKKYSDIITMCETKNSKKI